MTAHAQVEIESTFRMWAVTPVGGDRFFGQIVNQRENEQELAEQDVALIRRMAARDASALGEFYDRYSALMFSVAVRILNDTAEAEDVLQEAFGQIWEKAELFDSKLGRPVSWAVTLVRNRAIDHLRASVRRSRLAEEAAAESAPDLPVQETANEMVYGHEKAGSSVGGRWLPAEQRRAIELAYFSGLTQNEISEKVARTTWHHQSAHPPRPFEAARSLGGARYD